MYYLHALVALGITFFLAYALAWTKHHGHELAHLIVGFCSVPTIVFMSIWCGQ
jgi:hypothetical protein